MPQAAPMAWFFLYLFFIGVVLVISAVMHWNAASSGGGEVEVKKTSFEWSW